MIFIKQINYCLSLYRQNKNEFCHEIQRVNFFLTGFLIFLHTPTYVNKLQIVKNYLQQLKMSDKGENSAILCSLPDAIQFEFREEQEMHSEIAITNLVDRVVTFKIKTNKPGLYLVKPMEGQIYNKSTTKISFKRKELTLQNFNMIIANPGQNREKFLIQFNSEVQDGVGISQKVVQSAYLAVLFNKSSIKMTSSEQINPKQSVSGKRQQFKSEKQEKQPDIAKAVAEKKAQLEKLISTKQSLLAEKSNTLSQSKGFTLQDLIYTIIFSFLLGFIIF